MREAGCGVSYTPWKEGDAYDGTAILIFYLHIISWACSSNISCDGLIYSTCCYNKKTRKTKKHISVRDVSFKFINN